MHEQKFIQAFAVLSIIKGAPWTDSEVTIERGGIKYPAAGPGGVNVKEVLLTAEEAQKEVLRLNTLNSDKNCTYHWQTTHLFVNGGSHGAKV